MRRTAIITGASSGIGACCAEELAAAGVAVCLFARRRERLEDLAARIGRDAGPDGVLAVPGDVTSEPDRRRALTMVVERWGRVDLLVNNAGYALAGAIDDLSLDAVRAQFEVNALGYLGWMQAVAAVMMDQPAGGRIINVGSVSGLMAFPGLGAYAASKYAVEAISDAARRELGSCGIKVVLVEPGSVVTEIWHRAEGLAEGLRRDWQSSRFRGLYEQGMKRAEQMLKGDGPSPRVVARAVLKAATVRRPRARYYATGEAKTVAVLAKLPAKVQDWILRRLFR